jgi:hypothetical protein
VQYAEITPKTEDLLVQILERYHFRYVLSDDDFESS